MQHTITIMGNKSSKTVSEFRCLGMTAVYYNYEAESSEFINSCTTYVICKVYHFST